MENIKIATKAQAEQDRQQDDEKQAVEFILDEILTTQSARDAENEFFSQMDERIKNLVIEYNAGQYSDAAVISVIVGYSELTALHAALTGVDAVEDQDELDQKMEILRGILNGDVQAAADVLREWQLVPRLD